MDAEIERKHLNIRSPACYHSTSQRLSFQRLSFGNAKKTKEEVVKVKEFFTIWREFEFEVKLYFIGGLVALPLGGAWFVAYAGWLHQGEWTRAQGLLAMVGLILPAAVSLWAVLLDTVHQRQRRP